MRFVPTAKTHRLLRTGLLLLAAVSSPGASLAAQQLAHRGWAGNNIAVDSWWTHLLVDRLNPLSVQDANGDGFGGLHEVADRLDDLASLGVDALVLSPVELRINPDAQAASVPWDPRYGSPEDFDHLEQEASRRRIRLLIDLPLDSSPLSPGQTLAAARFWLSRGVSGLWLTQTPGATGLDFSLQPRMIRSLRRLCASYPGARILIGDLPQSASGVASPMHKAVGRHPTRSQTVPATPQLSVDSQLARLNVWSPASLRVWLNSETRPATASLLEESDTEARPRSFDRLAPGLSEAEKIAVAKQLAAVLFTGREAPALLFGQEIGNARSPGRGPATNGSEANVSNLSPMRSDAPPGLYFPALAKSSNAATETVAAEEADPSSLLTWYRSLAQLWHTEPALHNGGTVTPLDTGYSDVFAWLRRATAAQAHAAPVVVVCNLSAHPVVISLDQALRLAGAPPRDGIRPLAVTSGSTAVESFTGAAISLAPRGVYLGELRHAGLEDAPAPALSRHRHAR